MKLRPGASRNYETAVRGAREGRDTALDLAAAVAADWIALNWPIPAMLGSRMTAARVTSDAICLSNSIHFSLREYSYCKNPVALPPGRAKLSTKPAPTGSG